MAGWKRRMLCSSSAEHSCLWRGFRFGIGKVVWAGLGRVPGEAKPAGCLEWSTEPATAFPLKPNASPDQWR